MVYLRGPSFPNLQKTEEDMKCYLLYINNSRESLTLCLEFRADETVKVSAELHNDARLLAITSDDLIAMEAMYHSSCYKKYTCICYQKNILVYVTRKIYLYMLPEKKL